MKKIKLFDYQQRMLEDIINEIGGSHGVREEGGIEPIVDPPVTTNYFKGSKRLHDDVLRCPN